MKTIPIEVSGGVLRLPPGVVLPPSAHLAVLALDFVLTSFMFTGI